MRSSAGGGAWFLPLGISSWRWSTLLTTAVTNKMSMDLASAFFFLVLKHIHHFCCGSKDSPLYLFETKMDDHLTCLNSIIDLNSVRAPSLPGHKFHEAPAGWLWDAGFISPWLVCSLNSCCQPGKPVKPGKLVNCRHVWHVSIFTKVSTYEPWCSTTSSLVVHWTTKIWNYGPKLRTETYAVWIASE